MLRLWIKDKQTGKVHEYGTNPHDALAFVSDGVYGQSVMYVNLHNNGVTHDINHSYQFCTEDGNEIPATDNYYHFMHIADNPPPQPDPQKEFDAAREEADLFLKLPFSKTLEEKTTKYLRYLEDQLKKSLDEWEKRETPTNEDEKKQETDWAGKSLKEVMGKLQKEPVLAFIAICNELIKIYERKNHDYGDSFHQSYVEEGLAMARIRIGDKFNRFKTLTKNPDGQQVNDESVKDTLKDMACYAIMTLAEMEREMEGKENENC